MTAGGIALAGAAVGLPWEAALLVGVALAPTDPAAVYATLRGRGPSPARTVLEGESGFNDPVGIALMAVAVAAYGSEGGGVGTAFERLALELGIGLAGGLVGGARDPRGAARDATPRRRAPGARGARSRPGGSSR